MRRAFITRRLPPVARELLGQSFRVDEHSDTGPLPADRLLEAVSHYDAILSTVSDIFSRDVLSRAARLAVISNYAIGLDNVDVAFARERGIAVYNLPDVVTESTADLTFGLLLALARRIPEAQALVREGGWTSWNPSLCVGEELSGKTLGLIGYGRIGRAVARRARAFGMVVIFALRDGRHGVPDDDVAQGVPLDRLLEESDVISLHVPLTAETRGLVDAALIRRMRRRPLLLNASRGAVVRTADLVEALRCGLLRGAALDVTDPEPIPANHPLLLMKNCLVVPHIGSATVECRESMASHAARRILDHFKGSGA